MKQWLPWVWLGVVMAGLIGLVIVDPPGGQDTLLTVLYIAAVLLFEVLGSVIASRQPGNRLSLLFWATGLGLMVLAVSEGLIDPLPTSPTTGEYVAMGFNSAQWIYTGFFYPLLLLMFVFPTGRFLSRSWALAGWVGAVMIPTTLFLGFFANDFVVSLDGAQYKVPNPWGLVSTESASVIVGIWSFVVFGIGVAGVAAIAVRYRRSSLVVRTQIKWVVSAVVFAAAGILSIVTGLAEFLPEFVFSLWLMLGLLLIPVSITVAITRFKLFEIDRIISRTISYTVVAVLLAGVYATGVIWIPAALGLTDSALLVAGSTLAVAALFNPLRRRVQRAVDRRFNRSSYRAEEVADELAESLQQTHTVDELGATWIETVDTYFEPAVSAIWLKVADAQADR